MNAWHALHRPSPLEFTQWLAALVPRPRLNLIRFASFRFAKYLLTSFHGVLAPNAKLRSEIIPGSKKNKSHASNANDAVPPSQATVRISWARLLKRVFEIDIEHCPHCGGNMKIIAAILERTAITKIPNHLGLLPGRHHDHLRRSRVFSIPADSNPSFSDLFLIELTILLGRLSHEREKCF